MYLRKRVVESLNESFERFYGGGVYSRLWEGVPDSYSAREKRVFMIVGS